MPQSDVLPIPIDDYQWNWYRLKDQDLTPDEGAVRFNEDWRSQSNNRETIGRLHYSGIEAAFYPPTKRKWAAWDYVYLGQSFVKVKDYEGARIAYTFAISLLPKVFDSPYERYRIKSAAYDGLVGALVGAKEFEQADLVKFVKSISDNYLRSQLAKTQQSNFYSIINDIERKQRRVERLRELAEEKRNQGMISMIFSTLSSILSRVSKDDYRADQLSSVASEEITESYSYASELEAIAEEMQNMDAPVLNDFAVSNQESSKLYEPGKFFLGQDFHLMLVASAADDSWYKANVSTVSKFVQTNSWIGKDLDIDIYDKSNSWMKELAKIIRNREVQLARTEANRR